MMSAFGDLFRHFPDKLGELCLEEAFAERRPVYYFDEGAPLIEQRPKCQVCDGVAVFHWRDSRYDDVHYVPPIPDLSQETCDDQRCIDCWAFFSERGSVGNRRRRAFKEKTGRYWWAENGDREHRLTAMALVILEFTIREKNDATNRSGAA